MIYSYSFFIIVFSYYKKIKDRPDISTHYVELIRSSLVQALHSDALLSHMLASFEPDKNWISDLFVYEDQSVHFPTHQLHRILSLQKLWQQVPKKFSITEDSKNQMIIKMCRMFSDSLFNNDGLYTAEYQSEKYTHFLGLMASQQWDELEMFLLDHLDYFMTHSHGSLLSFLKQKLLESGQPVESKRELTNLYERLSQVLLTDSKTVRYRALKKYMTFVIHTQTQVDRTIGEEKFLNILGKMLEWLDSIAPHKRDYAALFFQEWDMNRLAYQNEAEAFLEEAPAEFENSGCLKGLVEKMLDLHSLADDHEKEPGLVSEESSVEQIQKHYMESLLMPYITKDRQPTDFLKAIFRHLLIKNGFLLEIETHPYQRIQQREEEHYESAVRYLDGLMAQCSTIEKLLDASELKQIVYSVQSLNHAIECESASNKKRMLCMQNPFFFNPDTYQLHENLPLCIYNWLKYVKQHIWVPGEFTTHHQKTIARYSEKLLESLIGFSIKNVHVYHNLSHPQQEELLECTLFYDRIWSQFYEFLSIGQNASTVLSYSSLIREALSYDSLEYSLKTLSDSPVAHANYDSVVLVEMKNHFLEQTIAVQHLLLRKVIQHKKLVRMALYIGDRDSIGIFDDLLSLFYEEMILTPSLKKDFEENPYAYFDVELIWNHADFGAFLNHTPERLYMYYVFFKALASKKYLHILFHTLEKQFSVFLSLLSDPISVQKIASLVGDDYLPPIFMLYSFSYGALAQALLEKNRSLSNELFIDATAKPSFVKRADLIGVIPPAFYFCQNNQIQDMLRYYPYGSTITMLYRHFSKTKPMSLYAFILDMRKNIEFKFQLIIDALQSLEVNLNDFVYYKPRVKGKMQHIPLYLLLAIEVAHSDYQTKFPSRLQMLTTDLVKQILSHDSLGSDSAIHTSEHKILFFESIVSFLNNESILNAAVKIGFHPWLSPSVTNSLLKQFRLSRESYIIEYIGFILKQEQYSARAVDFVQHLAKAWLKESLHRDEDLTAIFRMLQKDSLWNNPSIMTETLRVDIALLLLEESDTKDMTSKKTKEFFVKKILWKEPGDWFYSDRSTTVLHHCEIKLVHFLLAKKNIDLLYQVLAAISSQKELDLEKGKSFWMYILPLLSDCFNASSPMSQKSLSDCMLPLLEEQIALYEDFPAMENAISLLYGQQRQLCQPCSILRFSQSQLSGIKRLRSEYEKPITQTAAKAKK